MRIAIISDIHGNLAALEEVLKDISTRDIDATVCLGDVVGYGPFPNECVSRVSETCVLTLLGNHDSAAIGRLSTADFNHVAVAAIDWTRRKLGDDAQSFLRKCPLMVDLHGQTFVHASPCAPEDWTYIVDSHLADLAFQCFTTHTCFVGHTHVPFSYSEDGQQDDFRSEVRCLINVGSVGQPRDGNPKAAYGMLDTAAFRYELVRVTYDIERTARAIIDAGLPRLLAQRLFSGL